MGKQNDTAYVRDPDLTDSGYPMIFWSAAFPYLEMWQRLSIAQRRSFLKAYPGHPEPGPEWTDLPAEIEVRIFETRANGERFTRPEFQMLLEFLSRMRIWSQHDKIAVKVYLMQTTSLTQRYALAGIPGGFSTMGTNSSLERKLTEGWFGKTLLASDSPRAFLSAVSGWKPEGKDLTDIRFLALRHWLKNATGNGTASYQLRADNLRCKEGSMRPASQARPVRSHFLDQRQRNDPVS